MPLTDVEQAVTEVWRREAPALIGALVRLTRDVELSEDVAQDALIAALEQWPDQGIPNRPGAWLTTVARRRAVDQIRRATTLRDRAEQIAHDLEEGDMTDLADHVDRVEDDVLRLMFLACHPVLTPESRAALCLRLVGGLTTAEIARAYIAKESAVAQRISRAKKALADAGIDGDLPTGAERQERLADVMAVVYLIFNEGYAATAGEAWMRPDLCDEALRLARILTGLAPDEPEVHGLQALMEFQASRIPARIGPDGSPVLLEDQDRRRWDRLLIQRGLRALEKAHRLGKPVSSYVLQAEIAACHARASRAEDTDWTRLAEWYDLLAAHAPGGVVEVNRAVAHGRAHGADAGLAVLDRRTGDAPAHLVEAVRADLLERVGRRSEALGALREAVAATSNEAEQRLLRARIEDLSTSMSNPEAAARRLDDA